MDTSKEYIKMCRMAVEIQELWKIPWKGDYYFKKSYKYVCVYHEGEPFDWNDNIYLPRQDQLSDMIDTWNKKYSVTFFQNIISNSEYRGIPKQGFNSIEKHLLAFMMTEKFSKIWLNNKQKWVKQ